MSHIRSFLFLVLFWTLSGGGLFAQSLFEQNAWETLPVFHNGRVMPLHTFAQQAVREICGTTRPYIVWDDAVIAEFNQLIALLRRQSDLSQEETAARYPFLNRAGDLDGGIGRKYSPFDVGGEAEQMTITMPLQGLDRVRVERLSDRLRQLVPMEGRYFTADELLFAWMGEPEVWKYIPIFPVPESDYLEEMFEAVHKNDGRTSQNRVSLYQLEKSQRYQQRLADIHRRQEHGQLSKHPVRFDQITERLERQSGLFRELTFHPQRQRPDRMLSLLHQAAGLDGDQSSFSSAFEAWDHLLMMGEVASRRVIERSTSADGLATLHPTTQRWHDITDTLYLLMRSYYRTDSGGNPVLPNAFAIEQLYEELIKRVEANLDEAATLMEAVYPGVSYRHASQTTEVDQLLPILLSPEDRQLLPTLLSRTNRPSLNHPQQNQEALRRLEAIRREVLTYYFSVKKLRGEIEAAYLALYDNGYSLRFLPLRSSLVFEMGSSQSNPHVQPWASAQMILGSGGTFVKRFLDPQIDTPSVRLPSPRAENEPIDLRGDTVPGETSIAENGTEMVAEEKSTVVAEEPRRDALWDTEMLFTPLAVDGIFSLRQDSFIASVRNHLNGLLHSYFSVGGKYGSRDFNSRTQRFQADVRQAAVRMETYRQSFVDEGNRLMIEHFAKTAYPEIAKLLPEYRYDRFRPFFWMWFFALIAIVFTGGAYIAALTRRKSVATRTISLRSSANVNEEHDQEQATELPDYTNSLEERVFVGGVAMLMLSILVAFIGGVKRAIITGWAPVTNMYETIVMMAFAVAIWGVWYALYPLLQPALQLAWTYSKFPRFGTLSEWLAAMKAQKNGQSVQGMDDTAAMRDAAKGFGVPGGSSALGGYRSGRTLRFGESDEAQRHITIAQRKIMAQCLLALPRLILTLVTFCLIVMLANGTDAAESDFFAAAASLFATSDVVDWLTVVACVFLMIWIVPHVVLTLLLMPVMLVRPAWIVGELGIRSFETKIVVAGMAQPGRAQQEGDLSSSIIRNPRSELSGVFHGEFNALGGSNDTSGTAWLKQARNAVLDRKLFIAITAGIVLLAGLIASLNRAEFNPDFRPIAAVLRSNFWLTTHVIAIVTSYAAALVAWGMAAVSLGYIIFGRYLRTAEGNTIYVQLPETCRLFAPVIERLLKIALLLLIVGTVLGARWADYSWGRFWSWDPKEVWALITILFLTVVLHGKIARYYGTIGITVGALYTSIAVIITWYGINYVFKGSVHAYGGGTASNATIILWVFIATNVLWGVWALLRYGAEVHGSDAMMGSQELEVRS